MLVTDSKFAQIVKNLGKRIVLIDADIQRAAVYSIHQSIEHRNATPANALLQAVAKTKGVVRVDALARYFEQHGNLCYSKEDKAMAFFDVEDMTGTPVTPFDEASLMATPWRMAITPPDITSAWDVKEQLEKLLGRFEKSLSKQEREITNVELIAKVRAVMAEGALSV